ncbi:ABC transporter substrate-binding protein [Paenibacillus sp. YIM B09110]|uniref:ABC transporter substrate-binding protein n=1 Tax=Paenibacillus sp. YIM B09110 TaxID=3126102 RepID=UPI00301E34E1
MKLLALLAMSLTLVLAGCSQNGNGKEGGQATSAPNANDGSKEEGTPEDVTLRMSYWAGSQLTIDKNNAVIELFQKAYPHIKIEAEYYAGDAYNDKINVQAASNSLPDIIRVDYAQIKNYVNKGLLMPLDDYIKDQTINMEGVAEVNMKGGMIDGVTYGINIGNNALVMFYDPDKLAEAGVQAPGPDYTWEQYEADLRTFKDKLGIYGDTHLAREHFEVWLRQHDKKLYNADQTALGYEDDQLFVAFMEQQLRWQKDKLISPISVELEIRGLEDGPFPKGESAYGGYSYWSNHADIMETQLGKAVGMAMYPGSGDGKGMYMKPSFFHGIWKESKHPKEAALFIEFFTNNIDAAKSLNAYFGMPYHPNLVEEMQSTFSETQKRVSAYLQMVEEHSSEIDPPTPVAGTEIGKLFTNVASEIFYEQITPEAGAAKFREEANAALAKAK